MKRFSTISVVSRVLLYLAALLHGSDVFAQCNVYASASSSDILCGQCITLSHAGYTPGNTAFSEDFNSGQPQGWEFTQQATFTNPCSPNGTDGTPHIWMGDNSSVPRVLVTVPLDFGPAVAPAGGTICFDLLFAEQGGASPCEGPDEPDEGVYLQYSVNGGGTWTTIHFFNPNGGYDNQLTNWNNWCFTMPPGALVNGVQFRWFQDADSGSQYDHWGIDNVQIIVNDPDVVFTWQHDNYTVQLPGANPDPVCPVGNASYTVTMTTPNGISCSATVDVTVTDPVIELSAGDDFTVCEGDCADLAATAKVVVSPASTPTYENAETAPLFGLPDPADLVNLLLPCFNFGGCTCPNGTSVALGQSCPAIFQGGLSMNINVTGLNTTSIQAGEVTSVCIGSISLQGGDLSPFSMSLTCPDGQTMTLANAGDLSGTSLTNACFSLDGTNPIQSGTAPYTGSWQPVQAFSLMNGCDPNGVWTLEMTGMFDLSGGTVPVGFFNSWSITFDDSEISYTPDVLWSPTTGLPPDGSTSLTPNICPTADISYTLTASDTAGCVTASSTVNITVDDDCCETDTSPITGPTDLCANEQGVTYSVVNTPGSTYTWTVPAGATIASGQGTNQVTVNFGATGGTISVVETVDCGDGPPQTLDVAITDSPNLVITDPAVECAPATIDLTAAAVTVGSTGLGNLTYWTDAAATTPLVGPDAVASSGTYYIQAGTGDCAAIEAVTVTIDNCESCAISNFGLNIDDCYTAGGFQQYDVAGNITYSEPPTTGTLTITNCFGQQQVINAPFSGSDDFVFTGLPQNGEECVFTAVFSDDAACTANVGIMAPPTFTFISSGCDIGSGQVSGTVEFVNPPATGTLVISAEDGIGTVTTELQPPFVSPANWTVTGLDPTSDDYVITFYFSEFPGCTQQVSVICGCSAQAGSTTVTVNGTPTLTPVLCEDDVVIITSNGNYTLPEDEGPLGPFAYQPALVYLVFNCAPTPGLFPGDDPCFVAIIPVPETIGDANDAQSIVTQLPPDLFDNGQVYIAPITLYHFDPITPNYIVNANCWALGPVSIVTYLDPITSTVTESCPNNSVTVTLNGGSPANNGSVFTASGLTPANGQFDNTTAQNNGDIVVSGLAQGDNYAFTVSDAAGCTHDVTGGPFEALPIANAGDDTTVCTPSFTLAPTPSHGTGTWTGGPAGTTFAPDANTPNATVTVAAVGTYSFTWTETNGPGCSTSDQVEVTFGQMSIPAVVTGATCGESDGEVVVAPQGGVEPYTYAWSSGGDAALETGLPAGPVTVTVTDATGCSLDSTFVITMPSAFTFNVLSQNATCANNCNGTAGIIPNGAGPFTYVWTPNVSTAAAAINLCAGTYEVEITENGGCVQTTTITIIAPTEVNTDLSASQDTICIGGSATLQAAVDGGTAPYSGFFWTSAPPDASLTPTQQNPTVSPTVTTTYSFVAQDANNCQALPKIVTVVVRDPLMLDVIRPVTNGDTAICLNDFATFNLAATGGDGNYSFFTMPGMNPITLPLSVQPDATTTYNFVVTDGCTTPQATASGTVTVLPLPVPNFVVDTTNACDPLTVQFTDLTQPPAAQWSWNFGDPASGGANASTIANPSHDFSGPGTYSVSLSVTTANGCAGDTVINNLITVHPNPIAGFTASPTETNLLNANIQFTDGSQGQFGEWFWDFGDGSFGQDQNPLHTYRDTGSYEIILTVTTIHGCTDTAMGRVLIEADFTFYIPNAFTPNNNRRNETFRPYGEGVDWDTFEMFIFNRWGQEIFYTADIDMPWDGSVNGERVQLGVYTYLIRISDMKGEEYSYRGGVTVLR
jgi:gliding motility-associated-like protein